MTSADARAPSSSRAAREVVLVTGISGSGKSVALHALEDAGFFCVDNLPPELLRDVLRLHADRGDTPLAIAVDVRSQESLPRLLPLMEELRAEGVGVRSVFLDASTDALVRRFSETRRPHPLSKAAADGELHRDLVQAIDCERDLLGGLREVSLVVDTSQLRPPQLRAWMRALLDAPARRLTLVFLSFAFKRGVPLDADFVFDVRVLPNPHYVRELRPLTGRDAPVAAFLEAQPDVVDMHQQIAGFLRRWLPAFEVDQRSYLTVAIGCTGGQHRSVYLAQTLSAEFANDAVTLVRHRELARTVGRHDTADGTGGSGLMAVTLAGQLVVAISSRALFDFEAENAVFEGADDRAYMQLQLQRLGDAAKPGVAFSLVNKLLAFNAVSPSVEVVILSRNDPVSGMRVFRSAQHYGLPIQRGVFTRGATPWRYLKPLAANLFLSTNDADVRSALAAGVPAARVYPRSARASNAHPHEVRIAFDGDAVLFSDEAEQVFQRSGLVAFQAHEKAQAQTPLAAGPFKPVLEALHQLQRVSSPAMRVRTALVTARSAPAHERAIRTLMDWNVQVDEAMFLGGLPKGEFLREFEPDFFFDDQTGHIENALVHVPAGHVASGIANIDVVLDVTAHEPRLDIGPTSTP